VRYYLYISDAKVNMLLPQVPGALQRKVSAKFGFDIKVLSGSLETERATLDNRVARLAAVEAYLVENEPIGTPDQPASWIQGRVNAKFLDIGNGAILFVTGDTASILGLGGSAHHLVGAAAPDRVGLPFSFFPGLSTQLTSLIDKRPDWLVGMDETTLRKELGPGVDRELDAWASVVIWASAHAKVGVQTLEFLAKRLMTTRTPQGVTITMASPLFIASAD